jgi:hypothetical protein
VVQEDGIALKGGNAKCRHQKIDLKRIYAAGVYLFEAQNPINSPLTQCIRVDSIFIIHIGRGERERVELERSWVENTNMTDCISSL